MSELAYGKKTRETHFLPRFKGQKDGGDRMVHWIWMIIAFLTGGIMGALTLGLVAANREQHRNWWDDD